MTDTLTPVDTCGAHQLGIIGLEFYPWLEWCPFSLVVRSGPPVGNSGPQDLVCSLGELGHLWSAPIGHYRPGILPLTGMMSLQPGCTVRTTCGQLRTSGPRMFTWGALASSLPTPPTPSRLPPTHPLVTLGWNWCTPSKKSSEKT